MCDGDQGKKLSYDGWWSYVAKNKQISCGKPPPYGVLSTGHMSIAPRWSFPTRRRMMEKLYYGSRMLKYEWTRRTLLFGGLTIRWIIECLYRMMGRWCHMMERCCRTLGGGCRTVKMIGGHMLCNCFDCTIWAWHIVCASCTVQPDRVCWMNECLCCMMWTLNIGYMA